MEVSASIHTSISFLDNYYSSFDNFINCFAKNPYNHNISGQKRVFDKKITAFKTGNTYIYI